MIKGTKINVTFEVPEDFEYNNIKDPKDALIEALNVALLEGNYEAIDFLMANILDITESKLIRHRRFRKRANPYDLSKSKS